MARSQADGGRRVDWFAAGLGLVLAVVIQLVGGTLLFGNHRAALISQFAASEPVPNASRSLAQKAPE